jgi:hypothetical protein
MWPTLLFAGFARDNCFTTRQIKDQRRERSRKEACALNELDFAGSLHTFSGNLNEVWVLKKLWCAVAAVLSAVIW